MPDVSSFISLVEKRLRVRDKTFGREADKLAHEYTHNRTPVNAMQQRPIEVFHLVMPPSRLLKFNLEDNSRERSDDESIWLSVAASVAVIEFDPLANLYILETFSLPEKSL